MVLFDFLATCDVSGSAASVLSEVISKEGTCEPNPLCYLCSLRGSISAKVVTKVCGIDAELQALFTTAVAALDKERGGVISLTLLRASLSGFNQRLGHL